jgi:hypothetical protein
MAVTRLPDVAAARRRLARGRAAAHAGTAPAQRGWRADQQAVEAVLRSDQIAADEACDALTLVAASRADLDRMEQRLIAMARDGGASWREVAGALGLRSRQAAEQRWLRLRAAAARDPAAVREHRRRQRTDDDLAGPEIAVLRGGVVALHERLARLPDQSGTVGNLVDLARRTLSAAAEAPPGAMLDLARLAVRDLAAVPAAYLGRPVADALQRMSAQADAADPSRHTADPSRHT